MRAMLSILGLDIALKSNLEVGGKSCFIMCFSYHIQVCMHIPHGKTCPAH